jgi:hypothetical protein
MDQRRILASRDIAGLSNFIRKQDNQLAIDNRKGAMGNRQQAISNGQKNI